MKDTRFSFCEFLWKLFPNGCKGRLYICDIGELNHFFTCVEFNKRKQGIPEESFVERSALQELFSHFREDRNFPKPEGELDSQLRQMICAIFDERKRFPIFL